MRRWREALVLLLLFPLFVLTRIHHRGLRWDYWWAQVRQALAKCGKDATFRTAPFADLIIASTALPYHARILCVGARNATEPAVWRERGYDRVTAIDLLPGAGLIPMDMHRLRFADDTFELVYASHCYEHAWDADLALAEATRVLRRTGWLFAAFPVAFTPSAHDRYDFRDHDGFLSHLPPASRWSRLWTKETPTECAVLLRLEGKEVMPVR